MHQSLIDGVVSALVAGLLGIVRWLWTQSIQVSKNTEAVAALTSSSADKNKELSEVKAGHEGLDKRVALVERAIAEFSSFTPVLQEFTGQMKEFVVGTNRRLEFVESQVFSTRRGNIKRKQSS